MFFYCLPRQNTKLSIVSLLESEYGDLLAFVCAYLALSFFFLCVCLLAYKIWGVPKYVSHSKSSADLMLAQLLMQCLLERETKNRNHYQLMPKIESVGCGFYRKQQN